MATDSHQETPVEDKTGTVDKPLQQSVTAPTPQPPPESVPAPPPTPRPGGMDDVLTAIKALPEQLTDALKAFNPPPPPPPTPEPTPESKPEVPPMEGKSSNSGGTRISKWWFGE